MPAAEVVETVHALVADSSPSMRFLLAVSLSEAGAVVEAEAELRAVLEAQPGNAHARVALAETLLARAATPTPPPSAASVDAEAPCAAAAQRTELFALPDPTACALDAGARRRAARRGARRLRRLGGRALRGPRPGRAARSGRRARRSSCSTPSARLQAFEAFESLVAVLAAVAMPWRERRQALAELYLRHGYADSAAEEWIAACEQGGVDVQALRRTGRRGRRPRARRGRAGVRRRGRRPGRGLIGLKFS